jgi:hypothetical protein
MAASAARFGSRLLPQKWPLKGQTRGSPGNRTLNLRIKSPFLRAFDAIYTLSKWRIVPGRRNDSGSQDRLYFSSFCVARVSKSCRVL